MDVFDLSGRQVATSGPLNKVYPSGTTLDLIFGKIQGGVYIVRVVTDNGIYYKRAVSQ
jgi:hypothetical protein